MAHLSQRGHRALEGIIHQAREFIITDVLQQLQQIHDPAVIHRRPLEMAAIGEDLLGQLMAEQVHADSAPTRFPATRSNEDEGRCVSEEVIARQVRFEMVGEPLGLSMHAGPEYLAKAGVAFYLREMLLEE